jgi:hypothetical protein
LVSNADGSGIVTRDRGGRLGMTHFFKSGAYGEHLGSYGSTQPFRLQQPMRQQA